MSVCKIGLKIVRSRNSSTENLLKFKRTDRGDNNFVKNIMTGDLTWVYG